MLILSRKKGEEIRVGKDITLTILSVSDNQIKIGIDAPKNVEILRGELYAKVKEVTIAASEQSNEKIADISDLKLNKRK